MMDKPEHIYLFFYTDSVAFPRKDSQRPENSFPMILKDKLEDEFGIKVYIYFRGWGGATVKAIKKIFESDAGYFKGKTNAFSFAIFYVGIVDCAPLPFTFIINRLRSVPFIGGFYNTFYKKILHPNRKLLQNIYSIRRCSPSVFSKTFDYFIESTISRGIIPFSIDTPLVPKHFEERSPGINDSVRLYNSLKHRNNDVNHINMDWVNEEHYLPDGHHFNNIGCSDLGEQLFIYLMNYISFKRSF